MNRQLLLIRIIFLVVCALLMTTYMTGIWGEGATFATTIIGLIGGLLFGGVLICVESALKEVNLRTFNIALLGLFFGYLLGEVITRIFDAALSSVALTMPGEYLALVRVCVYLFTSYFGMIIAFRSAEEIHLSIPFVKLESSSKKKKDIMLDSSTLLDTRIIDLATSGLLDNHLIIPRFILKELHLTNESGDEHSKMKARRCLEAIRKLENIPGLNLRYIETDFPDLKDSAAKIARLARIMDATIMTADLNRAHSSPADGTRMVNLNILSNALKAPPQNGEFLSIKIQRYGKDPRQGVGYLEDGTMVVVNGGADYLGSTIKAQIVSVKSTLSGRMIFCNAIEDGSEDMESVEPLTANGDAGHKSYYTL
jgi:uncharacterized protein YacL